MKDVLRKLPKTSDLKFWSLEAGAELLEMGMGIWACGIQRDGWSRGGFGKVGVYRRALILTLLPSVILHIY